MKPEMQKGQNPHPQPSGQDLNNPLPRQLAESLGPMTRRALMHGMRRRILRVLNQTKAPITLPDLAAVLPDASLSQISYHVLVLTDCGNVGISGEEPAGGSLNRSFISTGAGNPQLVAILQETETLDDVR